MKQTKVQLKLVALEIARQKKPHAIGEILIKPCSLKIVKLGNEEKKKIAAVSFSNTQFRKGLKIWCKHWESSLLRLAYFQFNWTNLLMLHHVPVNGICKVCPFKSGILKLGGVKASHRGASMTVTY